MKNIIKLIEQELHNIILEVINAQETRLNRYIASIKKFLQSSNRQEVSYIIGKAAEIYSNDLNPDNEVMRNLKQLETQIRIMDDNTQIYNAVMSFVDAQTKSRDYSGLRALAIACLEN